VIGKKAEMTGTAFVVLDKKEIICVGDATDDRS
jgi:hypothetical protein